MQDYGMRIYNVSICRFISIDPLTKDYPFYAPYQFAGNMPIKYIDLEGLEPAENGSEKGEYQEAQKKGTTENRGYTWNVNEKGNGSWVEGDIVAYKNGITNKTEAKNSGQSDMLYGDEPDYPNPLVAKLDLLDTDPELRLKMQAGLTAGAGITIANTLMNHFVSGAGADLLFTNGGLLSSEVAADPRFLTFARNFENQALNYFAANGTIEGFGGEEVLRTTRPNFGGVTNNLTLATAIGGTQGVKAQITMVNSQRIMVTYTIYDVFGAGDEDGNRVLFPGLTSMWVLQHHRNEDAEDRNSYNPFVSAVPVNRNRINQDPVKK